MRTSCFTGNWHVQWFKTPAIVWFCIIKNSIDLILFGERGGGFCFIFTVLWNVNSVHVNLILYLWTFFIFTACLKLLWLSPFSRANWGKIMFLILPERKENNSINGSIDLVTYFFHTFDTAFFKFIKNIIW